MKVSKTFRRVALGSMLGTTAIMVSSQALAAFQFHVAVKGKKQGQFKGESVHDKRKDKWMPGVSFSWGGTAPRDTVTGQATGRRQYQPLCFVRQAGQASPQLLQAWATSEVLAEVNFEFTRTNANGEEYVYQTIKITDATVSKFAHFTSGSVNDTAKRTASDSASPLEEMCFTFRKIDFENKDGKTAFSDDWSSSI